MFFPKKKKRPFPVFRFHPDPISTGAVKESNTSCPVCRKNKISIHSKYIHI
jgi:uncharacterized protein CbrC (UPF0167 family)